MPLFVFLCKECDVLFEKFLHKFVEEEDILCEVCGNKCEKQISGFQGRVTLNAKDMLTKEILPDAKKMLKNMSSGKDRDFIDVYGDK